MELTEKGVPIFTSPIETKREDGFIFSKIEYFPEKCLIYNKWESNISLDEYKEAVWKEVDLVVKYSDCKPVVLIDNSEAYINLYLLQDFLKNEILPVTTNTGLKKIAVITDNSLVTNFAFNTINKLTGNPIPTKFLNDYNKAYKYLEIEI